MVRYHQPVLIDNIINMSTNKPLVSICVITYNSSDTVIETLESAKNQTYQNIELIVSDDGSKDDTVEISKTWIEKNKERFMRAEVVTVPSNTGTSANYNRAIDHSQGEWIKTIDGDDILLDNCIQDNIDFITANPDAKVVFSDYIRFTVDANGKRKETRVECTEINNVFYNSCASDQYKILLHRNFLPSYSVFMNAKIIKKFRYDVRFKYIEDEPLWVRMTGEGVRIYSFPKFTSLYRIAESVSKSSERFYSSLFYDTYQEYFWTDKYKRIKALNLSKAYNDNRIKLLYYDIANMLFANKRTTINSYIMRLISLVIRNIIRYRL